MGRNAIAPRQGIHYRFDVSSVTLGGRCVQYLGEEVLVLFWENACRMLEAPSCGQYPHYGEQLLQHAHFVAAACAECVSGRLLLRLDKKSESMTPGNVPELNVR